MAERPLDVLVTEGELRARVAELGARIGEDYRGREIVLVCLLKGAVFFFVDLCRAIPRPVRLEFLRAASYGAATVTSGSVRIGDLEDDALAGRDVLVVEDIVDSGSTLARILDRLRAASPSSLEVCCLLHKDRGRLHPFHLRYVGFRIPDRFVVGYGLDHDERHRNLPYVAALPDEPGASRTRSGGTGRLIPG